MRHWYLRLWRVEDDGTPWSIVDANLKFAIFNLSVSTVLLGVFVLLKVT